MAFITNPCDAMHSTGNVCPSILNCAPPACKVQSLDSFGWNPSVIKAPHYVKKQFPYYDVQYVATSRLDTGGQTKNTFCKNKRIGRVRKQFSATDFLLLNRSFGIILGNYLPLVHCPNTKRQISPQDVRLFSNKQQIYITYQSWITGCYGQRISELQLSAVNGFLQVSYMNSVKLEAERNAGIVSYNSSLIQLVHTAPDMLWSNIGSKTYLMRRTTSFPSSLHNSIHPIWIKSLNGVLGIAHRHYFNGNKPKPDLDDQFPPKMFRYGFSYRTILYLLDHSLNVFKFSREWLFPIVVNDTSLNAQMAESIQFVSSAILEYNFVHIFYGINDCKSAVLTMTIPKLMSMLEFH